MSHSKERKEKNCLNCNAEIAGRFCSVCGQENLEPRESVRDMAVHFFNDITHFDGKFFSSLKYLFTKPGFLSAEYTAGRRASYLNPVRMYLFTSALFFLIYFSFFIEIKVTKRPDAPNKGVDSTHPKNLKPVDTNSGDTAEYYEKKNSGDSAVSFGNRSYRSRKEYDSLSNAGIVKDGFLRRLLIYKSFDLKEKYHRDKKGFNENLWDHFKHMIPQIFFLSLPIIALFLKLLYRRRKEYYYTAHLIFTIHFYVFVYLARLISECLIKLSTLKHLQWLSYTELIFQLSVLYYGYRAMKIFYRQSRGKTLIKYILLLIWFVFVISFLLVLMLGFTLYKL